MHVWVIEIKDGKKWMPCADAHLTHGDAKREMAFYWMFNNPKDKFRVKKYVSA
jgi:hypothetical protein